MNELIAVARQRHPLWFNTALGFAILALVCLILTQLDERLINGVSVWAKPFKFSLSFVAYFATLAWFSSLLKPGYFSLVRGRVLSWLPIVCAIFEIVYIMVQAARGQASHFNVSSPLYDMMYKLMGVGAVLLVSVCLWMGISILRSRNLRDPYVLAVGFGLVLTFALGGTLGGYLSSQSSHLVGNVISDADGLWLVNWSRQVGDLRVAHFFGMHLMQILPLAALPFRQLHNWKGVAIVILISIIFSVFTLFTFVQATRALPFIAA